MRGLDFGFADTDRGEKVKELLTRLESLLPPEWRVVACALCPTGELLISSFFLDDLGDLKAVTACVFPEMENGIDSTLSAYDSIMAPLDRVVHESQEQLQSYIADDVLPREWWKKRTDLDQRLKDQISHVERAWFGSEAAQMAVLGVNKLDENQHLNVNLSSRFDAAMHSFTAEERDDEQASVDSCVSGACVFLVLDENLQRFPFEGMSFFRGLAVCRQPSLPFLVAKLSELAGTKAIEYQPALIDFDRVSYILDPESNLPGMAKRLQPFLDELEKNLEVTWDRMVGEIPPKAFLERSVAEPEGLLLYFGHGNGQNYFSKSDIERLVGSSESCAKERPVRSSIILMGCSSGRLESVNRKGTKLLDQQLPMYHEPEGLALSYLAFGAPCVVGNLWDVTDRDIDAFAMNMLERFTSGGGCASVAECVAHARSACKLRYMIGCAPVCYGVPVFRKKKK
jgi:separase